MMAPTLKAVCAYHPVSPEKLGAPVAVVAPLDKSSAILGGATSALERLKLQQAGATFAPAAGMASPTIKLPEKFSIPGFDCSPSGGEPDRTAALAKTAILQPPLSASRPRFGPDDFLASKRLGIGKTSFDADWKRVGRKGVSRAYLRRAVAKGSAGTDLLASVNSYVNQAVRYVEDADNFGRRDYWASAAQTLSSGRGDCEDYAIAKLQLLAAAGVRREDMYLTIARDLVRNADHAVLVVKHDGGWTMLDNNTDKLIDAREANDYRPILSYSATSSWLHGY